MPGPRPGMRWSMHRQPRIPAATGNGDPAWQAGNSAACAGRAGTGNWVMSLFSRVLVPAIAAVGAAAAWPAVAEDLPVDLELVLAVDVSGSMDTDERQLQRSGYVAALRHADVIAAIGTGVYGRIAL